MKRQADAWKQKVHPLFLEAAEAYRDAVREFLDLGPQPPAERVAQISGRFQSEIEAIRARFAGAQYTSTADDPLDTIYVDLGPSSWPPSQREMNSGFLELLYWKRFSEPLWIALQKADAGDLQALRRVNRVGEDFHKIMFGKGSIKPAKGDPDHGALLQLGLDMGLSALSPEELADCFDAVCPCGKVHDADALKKQRFRKLKAIQQARDWLAAERAKMSTREWMFAYGKDGLFAKLVPSTEDHPQRRVYVGKVGKQTEAYVNERGDLVACKGSRFARRTAVRTLPMAFAVNSTQELFAMFFPDHEGSPNKPTNRTKK